MSLNDTAALQNVSSLFSIKNSRASFCTFRGKTSTHLLAALFEVVCLTPFGLFALRKTVSQGVMKRHGRIPWRHGARMCHTLRQINAQNLLFLRVQGWILAIFWRYWKLLGGILWPSMSLRRHCGIWSHWCINDDNLTSQEALGGILTSYSIKRKDFNLASKSTFWHELTPQNPSYYGTWCHTNLVRCHKESVDGIFTRRY